MSTSRRNIEGPGKLAMLGHRPTAMYSILFTTCLEASQAPLGFSSHRIVAQPDPAHDRSPCHAGDEGNERPIQGPGHTALLDYYVCVTPSVARRNHAADNLGPGVCGDKETVWK